MGANLFKSFSFATLCVRLGLGASSGAAGWTGLLEARDSGARPVVLGNEAFLLVVSALNDSDHGLSESLPVLLGFWFRSLQVKGRQTR